MSELSPETREAFAAARSGYDADPARLERVRERVLSRAGASASKGPTVSPRSWLVIGAVGLTLVGLGGVLMRPVAAPRSLAAAPPARPAAGQVQQAASAPSANAPAAASGLRPARAPHVVEQTAERQAAVSGEPASALPTPATSAPATSAPRFRPPRQRDLPRPASSGAGVKGRATVVGPEDVPPSSVDTRSPAVHDPEPGELLLDEAALIESARGALEAGDTARAGAQLRAHASRHPAGQLMLERLALQTLLSCKLQDRAAARRAFAQLLLLRPPAALRLSTERTCGAWIAER